MGYLVQRGEIMSTMTKQLLQMVTSGLTGRRETDIAYLHEQIAEYEPDAQVVPVLRNILGSLVFKEQ